MVRNRIFLGLIGLALSTQIPLSSEESGEGGAFFFDGELLYMQADLDGLSYAWTFPEAFPALPGDVSRRGPLPGGVNHDLDFKWDPGVRLAAGYRFGSNSWELSALWTYYRNHSTGSASVPSLATNTLIATWFPSGFSNAEYMARNASADWILEYNTIDLCLGRSAFSTQRLAIEPFLALRGAFLHQKFDAAYNNGQFFYAVGTNPTAVTMKTKNDFNGWGIRPGIDTTWVVTRNFSFYANGALSLLFGRYKITSQGSMASAPYRNLLSTSDSYFQNAFEIDFGAGLKFERFSDSYHFAFFVGYEIMSWFDQNQLFNYFFIDRLPGAGQPAQGDLGIQGLNGSVRIEF